MKVGNVQFMMTFTVVDMGNYDILLRLDFLIKLGVVIDVEKCTIQVK